MSRTEPAAAAAPGPAAAAAADAAPAPAPAPGRGPGPGPVAASAPTGRRIPFLRGGARFGDAWSFRRVWLLAFAAFALLAVAWSLAMPADGTTDERQHLERAYGAVTGHFLAPQAVDPLVHRPGGAFEVPKSLLPPNALCVYFPNYHQDRSWVAQAASCQEPAPTTQAKTRVVSWVGRYNPLYYLLVGGPLRYWPTMTGIILSRILAALQSAAFAATAVTIAIRSHRPLLLAALLTILTPTTIALSSTVNPNGVEITAAVLLWVCLVDLVRPVAAGSRRGAAGAGGSGSGSGAGIGAGFGADRGGSGAAVAASRRRGPSAVSDSQGAAAVSRQDSVAAAAEVRPGSDPAAERRWSARAMVTRFAPARKAPERSWFWRSVLARFGLADPESQRALLAFAAVSGASVLTVRAMGPFWFLLAVGGASAVAERGRVRELLRWRRMRFVVAAWAVVGVSALVWNIVSGNNKVTHTLIAVHLADHRLGTLLRLIVVDRVGGWFSEAFALDVQASWVPMLWAALSAAVLVPTAVMGGRRVVLVALGVAAVSLGVTVGLEIKFLGTLGWSQYGRYFLPGLAGTAVLLAGAPTRRLPDEMCRRLPRVFAVGAAFCQLWALMVEMTRVQSGPAAPLNPLAGSWHPAVGSAAVLGVAMLGALVLVALAWCATAAVPAPPAASATTGSAAAQPEPLAAPYHAAEPQVVAGAANP